jgi:acylphosphatase
MAEIISKLIVFKGSVQGIGFRYTAHRIAAHYGLTGYVRNLDDGSVEMLAQGDADDLADCVDDLKTSFGSYIRDVEITDAPFVSDYDSFMIKV